MASLDHIIRRAISPDSVRSYGRLTHPRSYGVYKLPPGAPGRAYRYGNHPVRMWELQRDFGSCRLEYLFCNRDEARQVAAALSGHGA